MSQQTVIHFTDSAGFGGAEQALLHLLAGLDRQQWRPMLFHHAEPGLAPLLAGAQQCGVELRCVPRLPLGKAGALRTPTFARTVRAAQPAVFHAHLTWPLACKYGLFGALLARVPAIVATAQLFVELPYSYATRLQQRVLARGVGRYIAVSHGLAQRLQQIFHIPAAKIEVIHNAIPVQAFGEPVNAVLRATLTGAKNHPLILTSARLDAQKGHPYLLQAAAQIPEAIFVLAGDGPERANLEAQAAALGVAERIRFLGHRQDIAALLAACDLFVLPSLFEGLPLSILEAMAAGKPVIATAIAGTTEAIVHGQTGLLVPPADPTALAQAIRLLLADHSLGQQLALAGKAAVQEEFSTTTMVQRVTQVYSDLLLPRGQHAHA